MKFPQSAHVDYADFISTSYAFLLGNRRHVSDAYPYGRCRFVHLRSKTSAFWQVGSVPAYARSSQGRLLSTMLAAIAEFERELIRERTGEGRKRAMAAGVKFGRKRKLSDHQRAEAIKRRAAGETLASIAQSYAVDLSMISRLPSNARD